LRHLETLPSIDQTDTKRHAEGSGHKRQRMEEPRRLCSIEIRKWFLR
jgi:hypothetical protein